MNAAATAGETATHQKKRNQAGSSYRYRIPAACLVLAIAALFIVLGVKIHRLKAEVAATQKQLAQARTETTQTQAELDKDKAASNGLQSQLDQAKSQRSQLQSQVDVAKTATTELQSKLDREKESSTDLQAELNKDKAHADELQTRLDQATAASTQQLTELNQAKIMALDLQSRLQKAESDIAELQPLLLKAGHMPITTSFEKAQGGRSFTLHINNLYLQPLSVGVSISGGEKPRSQYNIIGAGATQNVEKLAAGETVVITSEGYDPVKLTAQ